MGAGDGAEGVVAWGEVEGCFDGGAIEELTGVGAAGDKG